MERSSAIRTQRVSSRTSNLTAAPTTSSTLPRARPG